MWGCDRKTCPSGSRFVITWQASWGKPWSPGRSFLSHPHTHDRFSYPCTPKRKSYLVRVILPKLLHEGCTLVVFELKRMVVKWRPGYVKVTSSCHVASQRIQEFLGDFFKHKMPYLMVSKKKDPLFGWGCDRKTCPSGSPLVITQQASWYQTVILRTDFSISPSHSW